MKHVFNKNGLSVDLNVGIIQPLNEDHIGVLKLNTPSLCQKPADPGPRP